MNIGECIKLGVGKNRDLPKGDPMNKKPNFETPKISVVIPCFNAAPYLVECIESVLKQSLKPFEVIVINDGSTDGSLEVLKKFEPQIKILNQPNRGVSTARNRGMLESVGDWIAIQDADDVWERDKLEKQWSLLEASDSSTVCCYTDFYLFGEGRPQEVCIRPEFHKMDEPLVEMLADWSVTSNSALFTSRFKREIAFPEGIKDGEDVIFFAILRTKGTFVKVQEPLAGYRLRPGQRTSDDFHELNKIEALLSWSPKSDILTDKQKLNLFTKVLSNLERLHNKAYWQRDWKKIEKCRKAYREYLCGIVLPSLELERNLPSKVLIRLKDFCHDLLRSNH